LTEDPEVCTSLAERALRDQDFNLGYLCALIAAGSKPEWAYRSLLLGQAILNDEISKCQGDTSALQYIPEGSRLREAVASFSKAIELSQAQRQLEIEATALLDRAQAEELLGEADLAQKDVEQARVLLPDSVPVLREYGRLLLRRGEQERAIEMFRRALSLDSRPDVQFLLATTLRDTGQANRVHETADLLADIAKRPGSQPPGFREEMILTALREFGAHINGKSRVQCWTQCPRSRKRLVNRSS